MIFRALGRHTTRHQRCGIALQSDLVADEIETAGDGEIDKESELHSRARLPPSLAGRGWAAIDLAAVALAAGARARLPRVPPPAAGGAPARGAPPARDTEDGPRRGPGPGGAARTSRTPN